MPEQRDWLQRLRALTEDYRELVAEKERTSSFFAGAFGMKGGPADDPCHERYAMQLKELLEEMLSASPGSEEVRAVLEEIYAAPLRRPCPSSAYWMLLAVHGLTEDAIARLDPADARALWERYRKDHPRHKRLPVQEQILRRLKSAAEQN